MGEILGRRRQTMAMSTTEGGDMPIESDVYDARMDEAHAIGKARGEADASWYFDGSETRADLLRIVEQFADGDPAIYDTLPTSPLSGEWAGSFSLADLAADLEIEDDDETLDDAATMFEDGYGVAVADSVESEARRRLESLGEPTIDMDATYAVSGYRGIAWRLVGFESATEVHAIMIGDDRVFPIDIDDLTPIGELDYCAECGQIGCTHDGRER